MEKLYYEDEQISSTPPEIMNPATPSGSKNPAKYPPGYRFMPTDSELILEYLQKKINNEPIPLSEIKETYLRLANPMDLTEQLPKLGDNEWYFFTPRDRKYPKGQRPDRGSNSGYWKATGADKAVIFDGSTVGFRKALVFYEGKPQKGQKTNWIMHEFRVNGCSRKKRTADTMRLDDWVLCRLYEKKFTRRVTNRIADGNGDDQNPLQDSQVSNGDEVGATIIHEEVAAAEENLPLPENQYSYYYEEPIINNTGSSFGEWFLQDMLISPYEADLALRNGGHFQSYNEVNAYQNEQALGLGFQQQQPNASSWSNEAVLPSNSFPANNNTNFCDPIYSQIDVTEDKKRVGYYSS